MLSLDSQLPLLVFGEHLGLLFCKNLELGILLVLLFGDLFIDSLGVDRAFDLGVVALLLHDEVVLGLDLIDLALDDHLVELCFLLHLLAEVGLQILEKRARTDDDVSDLDGLKPDTPAFNDIEHLLLDGLADLRALAEHLLDG